MALSTAIIELAKIAFVAAAVGMALVATARGGWLIAKWVIDIPARRATSRVREGRCGRCGYVLLTVQDRCPECGAPTARGDGQTASDA